MKIGFWSINRVFVELTVDARMHGSGTSLWLQTMNKTVRVGSRSQRAFRTILPSFALPSSRLSLGWSLRESGGFLIFMDRVPLSLAVNGTRGKRKYGIRTRTLKAAPSSRECGYGKRSEMRGQVKQKGKLNPLAAERARPLRARTLNSWSNRASARAYGWIARARHITPEL